MRTSVANFSGWHRCKSRTAAVSIKTSPGDRLFLRMSFCIGRPWRSRFTREELLASVWGYASRAGTRTVDVHVAQVRAKLGAAAAVIRPVRGVGYTADATRPD